MSTYDVMASSMNWSDTAAVRVTGAALSAGFAAVGLVAGIMLWWAD